jgi:hypothetical protein
MLLALLLLLLLLTKLQVAVHDQPRCKGFTLHAAAAAAGSEGWC